MSIENNPKWWEGFDIETAIKECKRLEDENWQLRMEKAQLRNYLTFKKLIKEFTEWTKK